MSLKAFHAVFIAAAILALGFTAWWAAGHNAAAQRSPAVLWSCVAGVAVLLPYLGWKLRSRNALALALLLPSPGSACTVCVGGVDSAKGFFDGLWWGIVLLVGTTMLLVGGIVWALRSVEKGRERAGA